jgi:hypothetical protein
VPSWCHNWAAKVLGSEMCTRVWRSRLLERVGFRVLRIENAYVVVDMPDEPFKHPGYGLTTREALRLRRVIEQPVAADEGG